MIASIRGKKPDVYRVIILKQMADHTLSVEHAAKIAFAQLKCRTFQSIIYPAERKQTLLE